MNHARQGITRQDFARCVDEQVAFLHESEGRERSQTMVTVDNIRDHYDHGVSVDAAADDLFHQGF